MIAQNPIEVKMETTHPSPQTISLSEAFWVWLKVALYSFGGPTGQIAVMHKFLVEEKQWISENRFLHALNYCMLLPGPEAQQLATYIGWIMHKTRGGLMAGGLFVLPGFLSILMLSIIYAGYRDVTLVQALFFGLKPAVMAIVVHAVFRIGKRVLKNEVMLALATVSFIAIFFLNIPFPLIIATAGLLGYWGGRQGIKSFHVIKGHQTEDKANHADSPTKKQRPAFTKTLGIFLGGLVLWLGPVFLLLLLLGKENVFTNVGFFFSKAAVVTFGGAYAVLAYMAQEAVNVYGWLYPGEMLDGLGMAETTPGPLIQVVQYVGFMGAYRSPGGLDPMTAGILSSLLATWVTFVPCFMWIFMGAPYIEYLQKHRSLTTALSSITAAVVGVVLNLAVWFALHTLFTTVEAIQVGPLHLQSPAWNTLDVPAFVIAGGASIALFRFKFNMLKTLIGSALVGMLYYFFFNM